MFSILIPSYNNLSYLKICIESIKKNSKFNHQIVVHVNEGNDGTKIYLDKNNIEYTHTNKNVGLCKAVNLASLKSDREYIVYSHDDFYFCPAWDEVFLNEIKLINNNRFYLSGTMFDTLNKIKFFCGNSSENFDEKKLLDNYKKIIVNDFQGSTWAPHIIHREIWKKVGGFSVEFFPGAGSDPDFAMKLWNVNVRIFKGLSKCLVYHFGSKTLRDRKNNFLFKNLGSKSGKIFLLKWGITINFFKKHYLRSDEKFLDRLTGPKKTINFFLEFMICKLYLIYLKIFIKK